MGNGEVLRPGEFQRMSAGTGITHSEFNPSPNEPVHLYQIWLLPKEKDIVPSYEQKRFDSQGRANKFQLVASPDGVDDSLTINQDARIYLAAIEPKEAVEHTLATGRHAWVQALRGQVTLNDIQLSAGDGAAISDESNFTLHGADSKSEVMIFDLS